MKKGKKNREGWFFSSDVAFLSVIMYSLGEGGKKT